MSIYVNMMLNVGIVEGSKGMNGETARVSKKVMALVIGMLIVILGGGLFWWWNHAHRIVNSDDARVKGTIVALSAKIEGRVEQVLVDDGDHVEAGQVLVIIEKREFEAQVEQAKANLAIAQAKLAEARAGNRPQQIAQAGASVAQAKASSNNSRRDLARADILYQQGAISAQQRDAAITAAEVADAQTQSAGEYYNLMNEGTRIEDIQLAEAQVQQAEAVLKNAQIQLDDTVIKAPVAGQVALKSVDVGEVITIGQPLFSIANLADTWIETNIEETYVGRVKAGQYVEFTIDAYPGKKFTGTVSEVGPTSGAQIALLPAENASGNFTKTTQRLPVKIKSSDSGEFVLKPGMSAIVDIYVQ